ncbi:hypothetical protein Dimus_010512, partial [Dionaea muscipula]
DPSAAALAANVEATTFGDAEVVVDEAAEEVVMEEVVEIARDVVAIVEEEVEAVEEKLSKQMSLVVKYVDNLIRAIKDDIPRSIQANTNHIEDKIAEALKDIKTRFELMESKLKMTELDVNINFNLKITKAEENLGQKIDENSSRLFTVEETLASLVKPQQEQNETNKPLTDFLVTNFLGDAKKRESFR